MAPGDTMQGRRRDPVLDHRGRLRPPFDDMEPGDYCGPVNDFTGDKPAVFFLKPHARDADTPSIGRGVQHVVSPPHVFTEEPDGTLTISASISDTRRGSSDSDGWHGFLERGVWRQV